MSFVLETTLPPAEAGEGAGRATPQLQQQPHGSSFLCRAVESGSCASAFQPPAAPACGDVSNGVFLDAVVKKIYLEANVESVWLFQFSLRNYLGSSNYLFEIGMC